MTANARRREIHDFAMAGNGGATMIGRVFPDGVVAAFPQQPATLLAQMKQQIPPFHAATACPGVTLTREAAVNNR